jgi:hypothetical protein
MKCNVEVNLGEIIIAIMNNVSINNLEDKKIIEPYELFQISEKLFYDVLEEIKTEFNKLDGEVKAKIFASFAHKVGLVDLVKMSDIESELQRALKALGELH